MLAPFKPVIRDELDVSNFAEEFTEMDPTYSPAALPQNCDRIFQVGGCKEMLKQPDFCRIYFDMVLLFYEKVYCTLCRSLHRTTFMLPWADACLGFGCRQRVDTDKNVLCIIYLLSVTIFEILHSNWSNQVKFWMSSKGCCKSTWDCLCALVFKLTKESFYWGNCCHMQLILKKQMWMTIFDVALNQNMAHNCW